MYLTRVTIIVMLQIYFGCTRLYEYTTEDGKLSREPRQTIISVE